MATSTTARFTLLALLAGALGCGPQILGLAEGASGADGPANTAPVVHPLGGKPGPAPLKPIVGARFVTGNAPASADISQYNPPVGDQGQIGDCTSWAFGYGLAGYLANQAGATGTLFAPMFLFTQVAPSGSTDFGMSAQEAYQLMNSGGCDTAAHYDQNMPKTFKDNGASVPGLMDDAAANDTVDAASAATKQNAASYLLSSFQTVYATNPQGSGVCPGYAGGTGPIQAAISGGAPVVVTIPVPPEFDNYNGQTPVTPPTATEVSRGEHLLLCTKYDPAGLWCQNSWGTGWGLQGWVQLSWAFVEACVVETDTASGLSVPNATPVTPIAPSPSLTNPTSGASVSGSLSVTVLVTPGSNPISTVAVQANGTSFPTATNGVGGYAVTLDTTTFANGSLTLVAVAQDSQGLQGTSQAVTVTVANVAASDLSVAMSTPADGSSVSGLVSVTAAVIDDTAQVTRVDFTANGAVIGSASTAPWQIAWDTTQVTNGSYAVTATVYDSANLEASCSANTVTVAN